MDILRFLSVLCCFGLFSTGVSGQGFFKKKKPEQISVLRDKIREDYVSKLIADRVDVTKKKIISDDLIPITYVDNKELLESESLRFPADELYESNWDTRWVNPFRSQNITFPDSFKIDCSSFVLPIDNEIRITSKYGPRRRRMHRGIDLKVYIGDTIRAAFSGKIRIKNYERRGYGKYLVIRHPNGLETIYGHLSKFLVTENEIVRAGQPIALGGNTGRSTGSHLHFETRFLGEAINPSHIIDFETGTPHEDFYVFRKNNFHNRNNNIYTSTSEHIVYHRVRRGETLSHISRKYRISVAELCRLNGLKRRSILRVGQTIRCGKIQVKASKKSKKPKIAQKTTKVEETKSLPSEYHEVKAKETLMSIARQHDTTVEELCKLNNIHSTTPLRPGQKLYYCAAKRKDSPSTNEKEIAENTETDEAKETANEITTSEEPVIASVNDRKEEKEIYRSNNHSKKTVSYHSVKYGETLYSISRRYGISVDELCRLNDITRNETIQVGQQLQYNGNTAKAKGLQTASSQKSTSPVYHRIRKGDTLSSIARQHGLSVDQLCELNNIRKTTILRTGHTLRCL